MFFQNCQWKNKRKSTQMKEKRKNYQEISFFLNPLNFNDYSWTKEWELYKNERIYSYQYKVDFFSCDYLGKIRAF